MIALRESDTLAVTVCATEKYQYAMRPQARAVHANLRDWPGRIVVVLVGDNGLEKLASFYYSLFSPGFSDRFSVETNRTFKQTDGGENYKHQAQLLIAQMRSAAFTLARSAGADLCWSLDSDVIPKSAMCFKTLHWLLSMPDGHYAVAIAPYPSQGGALMLTGRGTPEHPIAQDFAPHEREIPPDLQARIDANTKAIQAVRPPAQHPKEVTDEAQALQKLVEECPPKGSVFEMNARHGWRRRGWLDNAYPGLGRGSIVPTDWCGFGCTLMNRRALDECDFTGYDGAGTEDLFVVWNRWHQAGLRIGSALHEPAFHVSRRSDGKYFASFVRFVTDADEFKGECVGHVRILQKPFYCHDQGEKYDPANDGNPMSPEARAKAAADLKAAQDKAAYLALMEKAELDGSNLPDTAGVDPVGASAKSLLDGPHPSGFGVADA